ncbi:Nramp family divalent metal transporter [Streptomyces sp. NPDC047046]|uniref:Nramp family divalent metal transporter n=1 Tax=Streptomyces sp. NPDC047046 TaxID=3155378 RepID=UPI003401397D
MRSLNSEDEPDGRRGASAPAAGAHGSSPLMRRRRGLLLSMGPAFVASIAYADPGNFATNFEAGGAVGYRLLWVVIAANLAAMLVQYLSAKLGLATGEGLPAHCRRRLPRWLTVLMWAEAEVVAIATDLAEIVGGALALQLLFGVPLWAGGLVTGAVAVLLLATGGDRRLEKAVIAVLAVIMASFVYGVVRAGGSVHDAVQGLVPSLPGDKAVVLGTGIIGATLMPHVVYLHSALTAERFRNADNQARRQALRGQRWDVGVAMSFAGLINIVMLLLAAGLFHGTSHDVDDLTAIHQLLAHTLGPVAAALFAVALLASGLASSGVGTYAGQEIMAGFLHRRIPLLLRRLITLTPALIILLAGIDPSTALVWSQVLLSFGIPFALVPLVLLTSRRTVMKEFTNRTITVAAAVVISVVVVSLNVVLLVRTL